jgi:hypothetical protein
MNASPNLVVLHGPAASGKLAIARDLAALTGVALFHNHLTVDLLLALFPFGSPEFIHHRESIWLDLMSSAIAAGRSVVFTFTPERTVRPEFPPILDDRIASAGGIVSWIEVRCEPGIRLQRLGTASRKAFHKLDSPESYQRLEADGVFAFPPIPSSFMVDSTNCPAFENARNIARHLGLGRHGPDLPSQTGPGPAKNP